jgi:signal peptidase I
MRARRWSLVLWCLAGIAGALLLVKFFVADVYRVDSGSMRPTLFGGRARPDAPEDTEHVLVLYDRDFRPQRFDLVVMRARDGKTPLVKRACGLPGDRDLVIRDGDLLIAGRRLAPETPRPAPVLVYDDRYLEPERFFHHRADGSVRREGDAWVVDGSIGPLGGSFVLYHPALRDDYLDREHRRVAGVVEVNDAILELEFALPVVRAGQRVMLQLVEQSDVFEVVLAQGETAATLRLTRRNWRTLQAHKERESDPPPEREILLGEVPITLSAERWIAVRFSNLDNHLSVRCPALGVGVEKSYDENEPWLGRLPGGQKTPGARVLFGAEGGVARFRAVRILRDLYYVDEGVYGTRNPESAASRREPQPITLGPDEYFLLGDNSAASNDSRHFGALKARELLGRPVAVVWPRPRWLRSVGP